jgi:hypothetical protein
MDINIRIAKILMRFVLVAHNVEKLYAAWIFKKLPLGLNSVAD